MVLPLLVDDDHHLVALERAQQVRPELALARGVAVAHRRGHDLVEPLAGGDLRKARGRHADVELPVEGLAERGEIPVLGVRVVRRVGVQRGHRDVVDPLRDRVRLALAVEDLPAHPVDDLALLVHHVVVLEQVLADLVVVRLDALMPWIRCEPKIRSRSSSRER